MPVSRALILPVLLSLSAQAVNLNPVQRLQLTGPAPASAVAGLPDGSRLVCLGSRWVKLSATGQVTLSVPLLEACQSINVSPNGEVVLTSPGGRVWSTRDGQLIRELPNALSAGFLNNQEVLIRTTTGLERLNVSSGQSSVLRSGTFTALILSPDGSRAVGSDGQRVQFLSLPDLTSLSAYRCESNCTVQNATFSADGRTAIAQVGKNLVGLRDGVPASTVYRNVENAVGFAQPDNTVLTISETGVEVHDFQTGRREKQVTTGATAPAALLPGGRILALSDRGELLDADLNFKDVKRTPLPAQVQGGGLDASGNVYALSKGILTLGQKRVNGTYWAVETMNKTTWALRSDSDGGLQVGTLSGEKFTPIPGSPRSATHLSVNHWGNHAAVWDDETLWIISQPKNKVIATVKLTGKLSRVTVSPDGTRAYLTAEKGDTQVLTLTSGQRAPLPLAGTDTNLLINGKGIQMLASNDKINIYAPNAKQATVTLNGQAQQARFSPDNKWLALPRLGQQGTRIDLINLETGKLETNSAPLASPPTFLTWSADSKKLAVGASLLNELSSVTVFDVR